MTLHNEVDLEQLSARLRAAVNGTMQPTYVPLWLRSPERHTKELSKAADTKDKKQENV